MSEETSTPTSTLEDQLWALADEGVPEEGWGPQDFPQVTAAPIPYTSYPQSRPDPYITITHDGWLFLEVGNIRLALPDRAEWNKLTNMVERMWNTYEAQERLPEMEEFDHEPDRSDGDSERGTPPTGD